ncbi:MAG TPA: GNAT family protein [Acidobacteriaceae bacterium]|nr:GNAT family protein [Acidobacteriaceae bacterium]
MNELDNRLDPTPAPWPKPIILSGNVVTLRPFECWQAETLYNATHGPEKEDLWRYMSEGPFPSWSAFEVAFEAKVKSTNPLFFAIVDNATGLPVGQASYLRIEPVHRVLEVGNIVFTPSLQRSRGATEAMYLMARHAFRDLGYRRYEWKCNALNYPSRQAALRLGFVFEGIFRQHMIIKGRNRDTAWFSITDAEWPQLQANFEQWLAPSNFDAEGRQILSLSRLNSNVSPKDSSATFR